MVSRSFPRFQIIIIPILVALTLLGGCGNPDSNDPETFPKLSAPDNVIAASGNGSVTVRWDPVPGATSYSLYTASQSGVTRSNYGSLPDGAKLDNVTTPFTRGGLQNGKAYFFVVTAISPAGESPESAELPCIPQPVPTVVSASGGDNQVAVSWELVPGADNYNVYSASDNGVNKFNYGSLPDGKRFQDAANPFTAAGFTNGKTYFFVVTAMFGNTESGESPPVPALPGPGATSPLTLDATEIMDVKARVNGTFTNPPGSTTSAWFEYGISPAYGDNTAPGYFAASGTIPFSATLSGLSGSTVYHYRIVTQNSGGTFPGTDRTFQTFVQPESVASALDGPAGLAVDNTGTVYWGEKNPPAIKKWSGGQPDNLVSLTGQIFIPTSIATDGLNVYWTDDAASSVNMFTPDNVVVTLATQQTSPAGIRISGGNVFWVANNAIRKVGSQGEGQVTTLATGTSIAGMDVDSTGVYWIDQNDGTLRKTGLDGGPSTILALGLAVPRSIIVDNGFLYWGEEGAIKAIGTGGGTARNVSVAGQPTWLVKDGANLYWSEFIGEIRKVSVQEGTPSILVVGQGIDKISSLSLAPAHVYWIVSGDSDNPPLGMVQRLQKIN